MKKIAILSIILSSFFCTGFLGFFENDDKVDPSKIYCFYQYDRRGKPTGLTDTINDLNNTGHSYIDGFLGILKLGDQLDKQIVDHVYACSYSKNDVPDKKFLNQINKGLLSYIVFYNGAISKYCKIFNNPIIKDTTMKSKIDYIGLIDKDGNIIKLDKFDKQLNILPISNDDLNNLHTYKLEK